MQQSLQSALAACQGIAVVASCGDGLTTLRQVASYGQTCWSSIPTCWTKRWKR